MSNNTDNFDCRTIQNESVCEHLSQWNLNKTDEIARICTCRALNVVIFPKYRNLGKITQKLLAVKPVFQCPKLQKMRIDGLAPKMVAVINKNEYTAWNND